MRKPSNRIVRSVADALMRRDRRQMQAAETLLSLVGKRRKTRGTRRAQPPKRTG